MLYKAFEELSRVVCPEELMETWFEVLSEILTLRVERLVSVYAACICYRLNYLNVIVFALIAT